MFRTCSRRTRSSGCRFGQRQWGWVILVVTTIGFSLALRGVGAPSPVLFGALLAGITTALMLSAPPVPPEALGLLGQAIIGATIGAMIDLATLRTLGGSAVPVVGVSLATLLLSLIIGQGLRVHSVNAVTAAFAFIAGGASGIVAMARDLGADDRVVTVVQYLRVVLIVLGMPVVTTVVFHPERGQGAMTLPTSGGPFAGLVFAATSVGVGLALSHRTRMPAGAVLGPLVVSVALSVALPGDLAAVSPPVPTPVANLGYLLVGAQVGLRFTRASLRRIARMLPTAIVLIVALIAATAGLGVALARWTGVSELTAYLATTPGGLFAVLATAVDTGADVTFVLAVQVIRLLVMLLLAPLIARGVRGRRR